MNAPISPTTTACALTDTPPLGARPVHRFIWGLTPYEQALTQQRQLWQETVTAAASEGTATPGALIFTEHPAVITMGKREKGEGIKVPSSTLAARNIGCFPIERGGKATLHSPGQLVGYFILPLRQWKLSVKCFVAALEKAMAVTCTSYGIAGAIAGSEVGKPVGCWIGSRKIGQIGIAVNRGVTIHGLAFNITNDLNLFSLIDPCGLGAVEVTSIARELVGSGATPPTVAAVQERLQDQLSELLHLSILH